MSVRVNLLPRELEERGAQRRQAYLGAAGVLLFLLALVAFILMRQSAVRDAVATRDLEQAEVNQLQAEVTSLAGFQVLLDQQIAGNTMVIAAMGDEIGVARVLNDVALTLPTTSSLTALTMTRTEVLPETPGALELGGQVASISLSGYSIERYAPGVEGVLLQFEEISGLDISFLNQAAAADINGVPITAFDASGFLNDEIYTRRYADGMPQETQ